LELGWLVVEGFLKLVNLVYALNHLLMAPFIALNVEVVPDHEFTVQT